MSYASYCRGITGQTGNIDLTLPNQSIPYMTSIPYDNSGATGFVPAGSTANPGITGYSSPCGYTWTVYNWGANANSFTHQTKNHCLDPPSCVFCLTLFSHRQKYKRFHHL